MSNHIFVVRRYGPTNASWNEHPEKTFDEAVQFATDKVRDGKVSSSGLEVVELLEVRRTLVRAEITSVVVTEAAS